LDRHQHPERAKECRVAAPNRHHPTVWPPPPHAEQIHEGVCRKIVRTFMALLHRYRGGLGT